MTRKWEHTGRVSEKYAGRSKKRNGLTLTYRITLDDKRDCYILDSSDYFDIGPSIREPSMSQDGYPEGQRVRVVFTEWKGLLVALEVYDTARIPTE